MEPGLYLTFFTEGETIEQELPAVGPLEHLVIREHLILADRTAARQPAAPAAGSQWTEAELELGRAMGTEPGGAHRPHLRVVSLNGVYLRFLSFADANEPRPLSELGPFDVVELGPRGVEADGELLAEHSRQKYAGWELQGESAQPGKEFRPDIAFRTGSTNYYPGVFGARPPIPESSGVIPDTQEGATTQAPRRARRTDRVGATKPAIAPIGSRVARARMADGSTDVASAGRAARFDLTGAAWRLRIGIIAGLVLVNVVVAIGPLKGMLAPESSASVGHIGNELKSSRWAYTVTSVQRVTAAGSARPQGVFLVIQIAATNRGANGAQLSPSVFLLVDAERKVYSALPPENAVYQSRVNPGSPFVWTQTYPAERPVATVVIFDVNPAIKSPQLAIAEIPGTRIPLD